VNEYRLIMTGIAVFCGLCAASGVWPVIDTVMTAGLLCLAGLALAGHLVRAAVRELRFRRYLRALDTCDAARPTREEIPA
jgi:hypothetical protein